MFFDVFDIILLKTVYFMLDLNHINNLLYVIKREKIKALINASLKMVK